MRYEIDYLSRSGNTKRLADAVKELFPIWDTEFIDLIREKPTADADTYIIVFSFNKGTVPLKIMNMLDMLTGKTILFLVTFGADNPLEYQSIIEQKIIPFLPDHCDYRGIYLCKGAFPKDMIAAAEEKLKDNPDSEHAHMVCECCRKAKGHPDRNDENNACEFVRSKLQL